MDAASDERFRAQVALREMRLEQGDKWRKMAGADPLTRSSLEQVGDLGVRLGAILVAVYALNELRRLSPLAFPILLLFAAIAAVQVWDQVSTRRMLEGMNRKIDALRSLLDDREQTSSDAPQASAQ